MGAPRINRSEQICSRPISIFTTVVALLLAAGCASPTPRGRYLEQIEPMTQTNLLVYRLGTNLDIRIPLRGPNGFAHASWTPLIEPVSEFQHRFATLDFDAQKWAVRRAVTARANRLPVHSAGEWRQLLAKIFSEVAPTSPNHATLFLLPDHELAVFHDSSGKLRAVKLENKPSEVIVDGSCNGADFAQRAVRLLQSSSPRSPRPSEEFFFATGDDPAFVLLDARERLLVFFDYAADPEAAEVPVGFAVRALNSLVLRSLVVTAIKNPVTLVTRALWHLGAFGAAAFGPGIETAGVLPPLADNPPMDLNAWEKELDGLVPEKRYKGRIDFLIDGENFFPAFLQSVANAKRAIDVMVFIFDTDDYAVKIADLLKKRSTDVKVRVLLDDMGSLFASQHMPDSPMPALDRPGSIRSYLQHDSRVEVRATANPWLTVDHRKCVIIDNREAYIGGMNIGRNYRYDWHDMMARLTGPIVGRLERDYRLTWAHAGPLGDFAYAWAWLFDHTPARKNIVPDPIDLRPLRTATGKLEILRAQVAAIDRSQRRIEIETPYFDDASCLRALIRARQRGVDVRVILPERNDSGLMQANNEMAADDLIQHGVRVYFYPGMSHVKAAIYDGWACLGSANFDKMSLRVSQELNVAFSDPATVSKLQTTLFDKDLSRSRELTTPGEGSWVDPFVKAFTDQL